MLKDKTIKIFKKIYNNEYIPEGDIDSLLDEYIEHYGPYLYQYKKYNMYSIDQLKYKYIYCSFPSKFDDVFDAISLRDILKNENRDYFRMSCFARNHDNEAMWTLYGACCSGMCIEYDLREIKKCNYDTKILFALLIECDYSKEKKYLSSSYEEYLEAMISKNASWEWQKEIRMIVMNDSVPNGKIFVPISKVILGASMKQHNKRVIANICYANGVRTMIQIKELTRMNYMDITMNNLKACNEYYTYLLVDQAAWSE